MADKVRNSVSIERFARDLQVDKDITPVNNKVVLAFSIFHCSFIHYSSVHFHIPLASEAVVH